MARTTISSHKFVFTNMKKTLVDEHKSLSSKCYHFFTYSAMVRQGLPNGIHSNRYKKIKELEDQVIALKNTVTNTMNHLFWSIHQAQFGSSRFALSPRNLNNEYGTVSNIREIVIDMAQFEILVDNTVLQIEQITRQIETLD